MFTTLFLGYMLSIIVLYFRLYYGISVLSTLCFGSIFLVERPLYVRNAVLALFTL